MTLEQHYMRLRSALWLRRRRIARWLVPLALLSMWLTIPFLMYRGWFYLGCCVLVILFGFVMRARTLGAQLYFQQHSTIDTFPTTGLYSRMRYPLYTAQFIIWIGFMLTTGVGPFIVGGGLLYAVALLIILSREEELMLLKFGEPYRARCNELPALWPSRKAPYEKFHFPLRTVIHHEMRHWIGMVALIGVVEIFKYRLLNFAWDAPMWLLWATAGASALWLISALLHRHKHPSGD